MQNLSPHDYPVRHFSQMQDLAVALKTVTAQVLRHEYSYESFGSWLTVIRRRGKKYQFTFDGRDQLYTMEACSDNQLSSQQRLLWKYSGNSEVIPITEMIDALVTDVTE